MARRRDPRQQSLPAQISKPAKRRAGSTKAASTPLNLRVAGLRLEEATRKRVHERLGRQLGKFALHVERATARFFDINGPRGGIDKACRIKVVLSGLPSIVVERQAATAREAFDRAASTVERAVRRSLEKAAPRGLRRRRPSGQPATGAKTAKKKTRKETLPLPEDGSLIGRRVGRSRENLLRAADRPEKRRRDQPVDTAAPGRSASDRKAGGGSTAKRNTKLNDAGMSATLEDSARDRPSRKPTRRSAGSSLQDGGLRQRAVRETRSPSARAKRGKLSTGSDA